MRKSISTRIFHSTTLIMLGGIIVMALVHLYLSVAYFQAERNESLSHTIDTITSILNEYSQGDNNVIDSVVVAREVFITARATGDLIFVANPEGEIILSNDMLQNNMYFGKTISSAALNEALEAGTYSEIGNLNKLTNSVNYWNGRPIYMADGTHIGFIFAASDASSLLAFIASTFSIFLISATLMLILTSIFSIWLTARMTSPLKEMADAARKFGSGDFSARIENDGEEEIYQLSQSFNSMAQSLQKIDTSRASFMGDIAHELRTPVTSIKGFVDGMLDGTIPPENSKHYLEIVSQESARLTRLIKNMLDITKLEAGEYVVNAQNYDIWESITSIVFAAEQRISSGEIKLCGFTPQRTIVYADPDLIHQVIYNIFDNALKFCPKGGEICFNVKSEKEKITISIKNTGDGIDKEALPYVFERFYKEDKSRGMNTSGSGLGLHICKVLVTLSGGEIWANSNEGEDCTFSFTLPTASKDGNKNAGQNVSASRASSRTLQGASLDVSAVEIKSDKPDDTGK